MIIVWCFYAIARLTAAERANCLRLMQNNVKYRVIADMYGVGVGTISRLRQRFDHTSSGKYRFGGGHKKKINNANERWMVREAKNNLILMFKILKKI